MEELAAGQKSGGAEGEALPISPLCFFPSVCPSQDLPSLHVCFARILRSFNTHSDTLSVSISHAANSLHCQRWQPWQPKNHAGPILFLVLALLLQRRLDEGMRADRRIEGEIKADEVAK